MKNRIKLKHSKELEAIMGEPVKLSILVQIAFYMDEETGEAKVEFKKSWNKDIKDLVILGLVSHESFKVFKLENKKIVDITLKRKPKKSEIENQFLKNAEIIPKEYEEYYKIAESFQKLFYENLKEVRGRTYNVENARFGKWVNPIRLMMEKEGVTKEQLIEVWNYLKNDGFWKDKVQSTAKLRQKFNTLYNQLKGKQKRKAEAARKSGAGVSENYMNGIFNDLENG